MIRITVLTTLLMALATAASANDFCNVATGQDAVTTCDGQDCIGVACATNGEVNVSPPDALTDGISVLYTPYGGSFSNPNTDAITFGGTALGTSCPAGSSNSYRVFINFDEWEFFASPSLFHLRYVDVEPTKCTWVDSADDNFQLEQQVIQSFTPPGGQTEYFLGWDEVGDPFSAQDLANTIEFDDMNLGPLSKWRVVALSDEAQSTGFANSQGCGCLRELQAVNGAEP